MNWTFEIIRDWNVIWSDEHQNRWLQHMDAADNAHVFFHPALAKAWVETYLPLRNLSPFFVWAKQGEIQVMLPLVLWKKNWKGAFMRTVIPFGYSDFDYHDPIVSGAWSEGCAADFWRLLRKELSKVVRFDVIEIDGMHASSMPDGWSCVHEEKCPLIALSGLHTLDDYLSTRNKKMRYNLRRQEKKAGEYATLKFEILTAAEWHLVESDLPVLLEYHRLRWPKAYKAPDFHRNLLRLGLDGGVIHFSRILLGDEVASWRLGFLYKDRYYSYMPTLNPKLLEYGVGKLHLLRCIDFAIRQNCSVYDQLRGSEMYKSEWTQDDAPVYSYRWLNAGVSTKIKCFLEMIKNKVR